MHLDFASLLPDLPYILQGVKITLLFTFVSLLGGAPLAVGLAICKVSSKKSLARFADLYTSVFRGTPLLVQLGLIYYGVPQVTGYRITTFEAGVLTFSLNSAAYVSEAIRAGIQSVDVGQWEAALVLGFSKAQTFRHIILPQAVWATIPSLVNEMVDLLKESALISTIGEADLMRRTQQVAGEKFMFFEPFLIAATLYYIMVFIVTYIGRKLEAHLRYA